MLTPPTSKWSSFTSEQFYRGPGCDGMVDGHDLSEVLQHHQHDIDPYRFMILRAQVNARAKFASKSPPVKPRSVWHLVDSWLHPQAGVLRNQEHGPTPP